MIVFHGSESIIKQPFFHGGKKTNDYGYGFYTTESLELAKEWACAKNTDGYANRYELDMDGLSVLNLNSPEYNEYKMSPTSISGGGNLLTGGELISPASLKGQEEVLPSAKLEQWPYNILNWLALLTHYRSYWQNGSIAEEAKKYLQEHFFVDPSPYDIIIGYRADDSYFSFAQDFVAGTISLRKLSEAMRLGKLGEQIVLKSEKAYTHIRFLDAEAVEAEMWYDKKTTRDREARREYRRSKGTAEGLAELYMLDIMREGITNGDSRLR